MAQEEGPEGPEHTTVTVQEPLPGPKGSLLEESLLPPGSLPEKPPDSEADPHYHHKLTEVLRRVPRSLLLAVIAVQSLVLAVHVLTAPHAVLKANQRSDERGQTAGSAAENLKDGEVLPPCGDDWIWYRNKCFYFSEEEGNWTVAKDSCAAVNSSLAMIDTQEELAFMMRYKGDPDHWIGLRRDSDKWWRWINGTAFSNWFTVLDYSDYAYLNHHRVKSGESYNTRNWIWSREATYERKYKREKTVPSFL